MVSVKVFHHSSGKPYKGARVSIVFDGLLRGGKYDEYTDEDGEVHFNVNPGAGKVYVDGKEVKKGHLSGMVHVYK